MVSMLLLFIAVALINNTIRLSVYSRRFIINTMQLVGATRGFIRKPFLLKSVLHKDKRHFHAGRSGLTAGYKWVGNEP